VDGLPWPPRTEEIAAVSPWTKSSLSHANGNCIEIRDLSDGQVGMRDSKDITGPVLGISSAEWKAFLGGVRNNDFNSIA
jgi:Domain of unknown function (DUF397)